MVIVLVSTTAEFSLSTPSMSRIKRGVQKDECCGVLSIKATALAMAKGGAGDYRITNPIAHLNGMSARGGP
jgi:hypothetical protein